MRITLRELLIVATLSLSSPIFGQAQVANFALPSHPGAMSLDLTGLQVIQVTAKPAGVEIGVRAHDHQHTELLAFLFLTPENKNQSAASCRKAELDQIQKDSSGQVKLDTLDPDGTDTKEVASMLTSYGGTQSMYKYFGYGDQCFAVETYVDKGSKFDRSLASALLRKQHYTPTYQPTSNDKFIYASILYRNEQFLPSVPIYSDFLASTPNNQDTLVLRRVATDNMGMALGMSGKVSEARKVFNDAVTSDPTYPLYYFNLACADAEEGNALDARKHLQQAFDRRANVNSKEAFPDPAKDDSILKLKHDKNFWTFVQSLSSQLAQPKN